MMAGSRKTAVPEDRENKRDGVERQALPGGDDACRCKETSEMKPRQLLKLMLSDLAFWKRSNTG